MNPRDFLNTIYLGDRACKKITIDGWSRRVGIQVDCISRLEKGTESWNYYNAENVDDGWLVFGEVSSVSLTPTGMIPDDLINGIEVTYADGKYCFEISVGSAIANGETAEVNIQIVAQDMTLETNEEFLATLR